MICDEAFVIVKHAWLGGHVDIVQGELRTDGLHLLVGIVQYIDLA